MRVLVLTIVFLVACGHDPSSKTAPRPEAVSVPPGQQQQQQQQQQAPRPVAVSLQLQLQLQRHARVSEARFRSSVLQVLQPDHDGTFGHYCTIWPYQDCLVYNDWCFIDCAPDPGYCRISINSDPSDPGALGSCIYGYPP
jgi:hypothetical protein